MSPGAGENAESGGSKAARNALLAGSGCGCLLSPVALLGTVIVIIIIGGFGIILGPLVMLILIFGGGGGGGGDSAIDDADEVIAAFQGDGKGVLWPHVVPDVALEDDIMSAGALCDAIGPVVIAAQIEVESNFNASLVGPNGEQGISQLPPTIFQQYGKDDDDNGKTSALDNEDSIMAQGRYMCELVKQSQQLIDSGEATGSVLDLALAGYDAGMDAVRQAHGVPQTDESQSYVVRVRALFAKYLGIAVPTSTPTPTSTPPSTPSPSPTA